LSQYFSSCLTTSVLVPFLRFLFHFFGSCPSSSILVPILRFPLSIITRCFYQKYKWPKI
jgi:hypothetical protein